MHPNSRPRDLSNTTALHLPYPTTPFFLFILKISIFAQIQSSLPLNFHLTPSPPPSLRSILRPLASSLLTISPQITLNNLTSTVKGPISIPSSSEAQGPTSAPSILPPSTRSNSLPLSSTSN